MIKLVCDEFMKICIKFKDRLKGLMFKNEITEDYLFPGCRSIHTFFMKINIDVICINKDGKVIKIYNNVTPNKIIFAPKGTYAIIESHSYSNYKVNDIVKELLTNTNLKN